MTNFARFASIACISFFSLVGNGCTVDTEGSLQFVVQVADAHGDAENQAGDQTSNSQDASEQQRAFLDAALAEGAAQETFTNNNIQQLDAKRDAEFQIRDEITGMKESAFAEREEHKAEVITQSNAFLEAYGSLSSWADDYKSKREELSS